MQTVRYTRGFFVVLVGAVFFLFVSPVRADSLGQQEVFVIDAQFDFAGRSNVSATLRRASQHAYWYVADDYWNGLIGFQKNRFTDALAILAKEFDTNIYPTTTSFWGSEARPGIDNDPRVLADILIPEMDMCARVFQVLTSGRCFLSTRLLC
jgi:hypothetical protein